MFPSPQTSPALDRVSVTASLLLHAGMAAVVVLALGPHSVLLGPTLPALMLYAPDRLPHAPRERDVPGARPLGISADPGPEGGRSPGTVATAGGAPRPELLGGAPLKAMLASGRVDVSLDSVYSVLAVDSQVVRSPGTVAPWYPGILMQAGVEGAVEVEFVVDTLGRVDMGTVQVLNSSHPEFTASVETALADMKFRPAWRGLRHVRQRVQQRFSFKLTGMVPPRLPS